MLIKPKHTIGASVIEVIVAISIFVIFASGSVVAVLGSILSSNLGGDESTAAFYAKEGISAVESIRNRSWNELTDGTYGLSNLGGEWSLNGASEVLGKYTRTITIDSIQRDTEGNIVSLGSLDPNTKSVLSEVTWNVTSTRPVTVSLFTYVTNWQASYVPTPTPATTSCNQHCTRSGYSQGACRRNSSQCQQNGETYESGGDAYCPPPDKTCCCI